MRLKVSIVPLLIVAALVGGSALIAHGIPTKKAIVTAEAVYAVVLIAADDFVTQCYGDRAIGFKPTLPKTCEPIAAAIQADVVKTDEAYQKIKKYEDNPPITVGLAFLAAVDVLKGVVPANFIAAANQKLGVK